MEKQIIVNCIEDKKFEQDRKIARCCYNSFSLEKENVFYVETTIFEDFKIGQYYTICPNCGYIVLLNKEELPEELKFIAEKTNEEDPFLYRKNNLRSELIHLESITPKAKVRTRINW